MKIIPSLAATALNDASIVMAGALRLSFGQTHRFWSGVGTVSIASESFVGLDAPVLVAPIASEVGGSADAVRLVLSGLEPDVAASVELEDYSQKPATLWRLIFDAEGVSVLHAMVMFRGRVHTIVVRETVGDSASIEMTIEGAARDFDRRGARLRSDADQRVLGGATDGAFKHTTTAAERVLYWGQKPSSPSSLNGGSISRVPTSLGGIARFD